MAMIPATALYLTSSACNLAGVLLLKQAVLTQSPCQAAFGAMCWSATALPFLALISRADSNLAVVSIATSACGFLAVTAFSTLIFREIPSTTQVLGLGLMIGGLISVALPSA